MDNELYTLEQFKPKYCTKRMDITEEQLWNEYLEMIRLFEETEDYK